jgi:hypothetical protein
MGRVAFVAAILLFALGVVPAFGEGGGGRYARYVASDDVCPGADDTATTDDAALRTMGCLLDYARRRQGLSTLRLDPRLNRAARLKLDDNLRCGEFSHTACGSPFSSVFRRAGYLSGARSYRIGENLAWGTYGLGSPRSIVEAWLDSPGHRENLFRSSWREMGIALARPTAFLGHGQVVLWANEFGTRS